MEDFINELKFKYNDTITNISKTKNQNNFIKIDNQYVINLDKISKYLKTTDRRFK